MLPGVVDACHRLAGAGWLLFVVTNQPDIARGPDPATRWTRSTTSSWPGLPVTEVLVCPHDDADDCTCRKPRPGMLLDAADPLERRPRRERDGRRSLA